MRTDRSLRAALVLLLLGGLPACTGNGVDGDTTRDTAAPENDSSGTPPGDVLSVTITGADGGERGSFSISPEDMDGASPTIQRAGDLTAVLLSLMGRNTGIGTATLKTRAPSPAEVRLDDRGETADALRLVFFVADEAGGAGGQYESVEGTATLTAVDRDRVAGTFEGTFEHQATDVRYDVRGSFDFQRGR